MRFGEIVVNNGWVSEEDVVTCLADQYDLPIVDVKTLKPEPAALTLIPAVFALRRSVLAFRVSSELIYCAISDPIDVTTSDDILATTGRRVVISLAPESKLQAAIAKAYAITISTPERAKKKRKAKIDPQTDRTALLDQLNALGGH